MVSRTCEYMYRVTGVFLQNRMTSSATCGDSGEEHLLVLILGQYTVINHWSVHNSVIHSLIEVGVLKTKTTNENERITSLVDIGKKEWFPPFFQNGPHDGTDCDKGGERGANCKHRKSRKSSSLPPIPLFLHLLLLSQTSNLFFTCFLLHLISLYLALFYWDVALKTATIFGTLLNS